jgi:hypothetical protein
MCYSVAEMSHYFFCFYNFFYYICKNMQYMKTLKKDHKIAMLCLKYIPVIMFFAMWGYTIFAVLGLELIIADTIVGCSILPSILIFALSDVFHFCWVHKSLTGYSLLVDLLINANKYIGLGPWTMPLKITMAILGIVLFIALIIKWKFKN